jgi:hypothetical protein
VGSKVEKKSGIRLLDAAKRASSRFICVLVPLPSMPSKIAKFVSTFIKHP